MNDSNTQATNAAEVQKSCSIAAIAALERILIVTIEASALAMRRGDTGGSVSLQQEARRIVTLIAKLGDVGVHESST